MTIPLNLTAPLKKLDYNYIGLENGYFNTDCTGDPFGIKAKSSLVHVRDKSASELV